MGIHGVYRFHERRAECGSRQCCRGIGERFQPLHPDDMREILLPIVGFFTPVLKPIQRFDGSDRERAFVNAARTDVRDKDDVTDFHTRQVV